MRVRSFSFNPPAAINFLYEIKRKNENERKHRHNLTNFKKRRKKSNLTVSLLTKLLKIFWTNPIVRLKVHWMQNVQTKTTEMRNRRRRIAKSFTNNYENAIAVLSNEIGKISRNESAFVSSECRIRSFEGRKRLTGTRVRPADVKAVPFFLLSSSFFFFLLFIGGE